MSEALIPRERRVLAPGAGARAGLARPRAAAGARAGVSGVGDGGPGHARRRPAERWPDVGAQCVHERRHTMRPEHAVRVEAGERVQEGVLADVDGLAVVSVGAATVVGPGQHW